MFEGVWVAMELVIMWKQPLKNPGLVPGALGRQPDGGRGETESVYACSVIHPVGDWVHPEVWVLCSGQGKRLSNTGETVDTKI